MTYKKNLSNMIIAIICLVLFIATAFYCVPRLSLLSSNAVMATVSSADESGTSGYAILKIDVPREDGGTVFFHYYYSGSKSGLKQDEKVLVSGSITFMDESTEQGVNSELVIGTKTPIIVCIVLSIIGLLGAVFLFPVTLRNFIHKPWCSEEEMIVKAKSLNFLYTMEILAIMTALILLVAGAAKVVGYLCMDNHATGIVTYQDTRRSSQFVKKYTGGSQAVFKSIYGKGIRPTYTVLQIKADSLVNGVDKFWYEGSNIILSNKKVYIGYDGEDISVLTHAELIMTLIGGGFLIFHILSALIISKRNQYGGKIFWFFNFD